MTPAKPVPALLAGLAACAALVGCAASSSSGGVPSFQVDAAWPQPLPNNWILGHVSGVAVDAKDHVWVRNGNLYAGEVDMGKRIQRFVRK